MTKVRSTFLVSFFLMTFPALANPELIRLAMDYQDLHQEVDRLIQEVGVDVNYSDDFGRTSLMEASRSGNLQVVQTLVKNKADVNLQDREGWTALTLAVYNSRLEIVTFLLKSNADANIRVKEGNLLFFCWLNRGTIVQG